MTRPALIWAAVWLAVTVGLLLGQLAATGTVS